MNQIFELSKDITELTEKITELKLNAESNIAWVTKQSKDIEDWLVDNNYEDDDDGASTVVISSLLILVSVVVSCVNM